MLENEFQNDKSDHHPNSEDETVLKTPNWNMKRREIKRVYSTATLLLHEKASIRSVPQSFANQCVEHNGEIEDLSGGRWPFRAFDIHRQTLSDFITNNSKPKQLNWFARVRLIKNIASAICTHPCEKDSFCGYLSEDCITISCDGQHRIFIWSSGTDESKCTYDIKHLGRICHFIITNGVKLGNQICKEDIKNCFLQDFDEQQISKEPIETAYDLLHNSVHDKMDLSEFLQHPFFWSDREKEDFINILYDSVGGNEGYMSELDCKFRREVIYGDWIQELKLSSQERCEIGNSRQDQSRPMKITKKNSVDMDLFVNIACLPKPEKCKIFEYEIDGNMLRKGNDFKHLDHDEWNQILDGQKAEDINRFCDRLTDKPSWVRKGTCAIVGGKICRKIDRFDGYSLHDLMRFLRNRKVHCWEDNKKTKREKEYYKALGGYWNFYSKRFPKLLTFLYSHKDSFPYYQNDEHFGKKAVP